MSKQTWKPGNMLYPLPVVMVSVADKAGTKNIITIAWAGTVCTNPPMVSISVRPERHSYRMIKETGEFVINLTTRDLAFATDYCGVVSGRDHDKFAEMKLTAIRAEQVSAPMIAESPVNLECRVVKTEELGSHHMFLAEVVAVHADEKYMDENGRFDLSKAEPIVYSHGTYFSLDSPIGTFGYSVRKPKKTGKRNRGKRQHQA
ncbi:MAG: flavin reductase family protein [Clostridiales bacterium]|nr:flavin reductase family protein [Clostridiales bacterium]